MRLLTKLTISNATLLITAMAMILFQFYNYLQYQEFLEKSVTRLEQMRSVAFTLSILHEDYDAVVFNEIFSPNPENLRRLKTLERRSEKEALKLDSYFEETSRGKQLSHEFAQSRRQLRQSQDRFLKVIASGTRGSELLASYEDWRIAEAFTTARIQDLIGYLAAKQTTVIDDMNRINFLNLLGLGVLLAFSVLAMASSYAYFFRKLVKPIEHLIQGLRRVADGHYSHRVRVETQDEIGELAGSFNLMAGRLGEVTRDLNERNESLKNFAAIVAHDLRSPLASLNSFVAILKEPQLTDKRRGEITQVISDVSRRALRLVDHLLDYARQETKRLELEEIDCGAEFSKILIDLDQDIRDSGAQVRVESNALLKADVMQFHELFRNLIINSIRYRREGVPPEIRIVSRPIENNGKRFIRFDVEDNGIGFNPSQVNDLFHPFTRLGKTSSVQGLGMGLSICKKIVERHGGSITAASRPGEGTVFSVQFPKDIAGVSA